MVPQPRFEQPADEDEIEFSFCTAWGPPEAAFETWALNDGRVQFTLEYWEPGVGFLGSLNYDGEHFDQEYEDLNLDPHKYKEIASEVWGYEEYEEPEPLTEWYRDGVKAKGLV